MKDVWMFYMTGCPHCQKAFRLMDELCREDARYAAIPVRRIEENEERALADSHDYWYVPTFYVDGVKLHEGRIEKDDVRRVFEAALAEA